MRALDTPPPTSPRLSCTAPCSPLFLTPPRFLQREIGLVQRPRFGRALPVRVLRRAKAVRLRSSIFRAFVYASNSEATFSLLSAPAARRHLVFARQTSPCSKLREKERESAKGRWVGEAWLPVSCALGVSRRNGAGGSRTVGAEAARRARVSLSPGSPGPPRLGAWAAAGPGPRSGRGGGGEGEPRPREARHMPEGSLPPRRPRRVLGVNSSGAGGPSSPSWERGPRTAGWERCPPPPSAGTPALSPPDGGGPGRHTLAAGRRRSHHAVERPFLAILSRVTRDVGDAVVVGLLGRRAASRPPPAGWMLGLILGYETGTVVSCSPATAP